MKPTAVIHIDALRREYVADWLLARRLEAQGFRVILTSRSSTPYLLRLFTPDVLFVSHVFNLAPAVLAGLRDRGVRIYVLEVEGVLESVAITGTYPAETDYSVFAGICVWNDWSRQWLLEHRTVAPEAVHVTGSIRNGLVPVERRPPARRVIGILSRFDLINPFDDRHNFENLLVIDPDDEKMKSYFDKLAVESESMTIVSKLIGLLLGRGFEVLMRPHPNENVERYQLLQAKFGPRFRIDRNYDITGWLSEVSVVVGPVSSAYTEAYLAGVPIVATEGIQTRHYASQGDYDHVIGNFARAAYLPASVAEAAEMCGNPSLPAKQVPELDRYLDAFYSLTDVPDPIARVVKIVAADRAATGRRQAAGPLGPILKVLIDAAWLCRVALRPRPIKRLRILRQYDYNALLHGPSAYMKSLIGGAQANG